MHTAHQLGIGAGELAKGAVVDGDVQALAAPGELGKEALVLGDAAHHIGDLLAGTRRPTTLGHRAATLHDSGVMSGAVGLARRRVGGERREREPREQLVAPRGKAEGDDLVAQAIQARRPAAAAPLR